MPNDKVFFIENLFVNSKADKSLTPTFFRFSYTYLRKTKYPNYFLSYAILLFFEHIWSSHHCTNVHNPIYTHTHNSQLHKCSSSNFKRQNTIDSSTIKENSARLAQNQRPASAQPKAVSSNDSKLYSIFEILW